METVDSIRQLGQIPPTPVEVWFVDRPVGYAYAREVLVEEARAGRGDGLRVVNWRSADTARAEAAGRTLPMAARQPGIWVHYSDDTWVRY